MVVRSGKTCMGWEIEEQKHIMETRLAWSRDNANKKEIKSTEI